MSSFFSTRLQELSPEKFNLQEKEKILAFKPNIYKKSPNEVLKDSLRFVRKVDIFAKDFIVIPINENDHWMMAIIC